MATQFGKTAIHFRGIAKLAFIRHHLRFCTL